MTRLFEPAGPRSRKQLALDVLSAHDIGDVATYVEFGDALGLDPARHRTAIQQAVRRAAQPFAKEFLRAITPVINTGYRIVQPSEHVQLARGQQRRSSRALTKGHRYVTYVELKGLSAEDRQQLERVERELAYQREAIDRVTQSQARLKAEVTAASTKTEEGMATLVGRLAALEARLGMEGVVG